MNIWTLSPGIASMAAENPLLTRLLLVSIELTLLAVVVALFTQLWRVRAPRVRALLWLLVLAKPVLGLAIGTPLPLIRFPVSEAIPIVAAQPSVMPRAGSAETRIEYSAPGESGHVIPSPPAQAFEPRPSPLPPPPEATVIPAPSKSWPISSLVIGLWLAGVLGGVLLTLRGTLQIRAVQRGAPEPGGGLRRHFRALAARMGVKRTPGLRLTDALSSPALVGLLRPVVLLPRWLAEGADSGRIDWLLRHELMHWKLNDPVALAVRRVAEVLFFFHPVTWWAGRRWEEAMELACDRALFQTEADAHDYAEQLYGVLESQSTHNRLRCSSGLFATRTQIGNRIAALLTDPLRSPARLSALSVAGLVLVAVLSLPVGCGLGNAESTEDGTSSASTVWAGDSPEMTAPVPGNPVETEVLPSEPNPATPETPAGSGLAWGSQTDGLRAAFEFVPERESYPIGEAIKSRFLVQNVSDKAIQIARATGQTDPGYWIVEDSEGNEMRHGGRIRWTGRNRRTDRRVLKPGETTILNTEEPLGIAQSPSQRLAGGRMSVIIDRPGRYFFRYHLRFQKKGEGDWAGELETGRRVFSLGSPSGRSDAPEPVPETPKPRQRGWGPPVDGAESRIWPGGLPSVSRIHWTVDEIPRLHATVRNQGTRDLRISQSHELCDLEVNGQWYDMPAGVDADYSPFPPGKAYGALPIPLDGKWRHTETHRPLQLPPGRYMIRVAFTAVPAQNDPGPPVRFVSNLIEVEMLPVPAAPPVWGETVNGLRAALEFLHEQKSYSIGTLVEVRFRVENVSGKPISFARLVGAHSEHPSRWIVEDSAGEAIPCPGNALWHGAGSMDRRVLQPGQQVVLEYAERLRLGPLDTPNPAPYGRMVRIRTPGAYRFRYRLVLEEKAGGDWSGELETGVREVVISPPPGAGENTGAARSPRVVGPPARLVWGEAVDGVRARLTPGRRAATRVNWRADEIPWLRADVRNDGTRNLLIARSPDLHELAVDGRRYRVLDIDVESSPFPPGKMYNAIPIPLDARWRGDDGNQPLRLSPGRHVVQMVFVAESIDSGPRPSIRFASNPVEIDIHPVPVGELVWGKEVNGLQVAMELVPEKNAYSIGEWAEIRFHVRNVSDKTIHVARETGHNPDHPSRWIIKDSDGRAVPCFQNALWHAAGVTDRRAIEPGQTAVLEYAEPVSFGRPDERNRSTHGRTVRINQAGRYSLRYKLAFEEKAADDWSGELETGTCEIVVAAHAGDGR